MPKALDSVTLSLVVKSGGAERVPLRSGLNWGQRPGRNPNQAYLSVPGEVQRMGFFPVAGRRFGVETDDGELFVLVRAQASGKALETPDDNALLGRYFRQRLGVESGRLVTLAHLRRYGRTSVDIFKVSELKYRLDFSID